MPAERQATIIIHKKIPPVNKKFLDICALQLEKKGAILKRTALRRAIQMCEGGYF
jgi:hypothetical protein